MAKIFDDFDLDVQKVYVGGGSAEPNFLTTIIVTATLVFDCFPPDYTEAVTACMVLTCGCGPVGGTRTDGIQCNEDVTMRNYPING